MQMKAWPFRQPVADQLRFVSSVVIQNQVDIQLWRHILFHGVEEGAEFYAAMAALGLADQCSRPGIQGGKQAGSAVARVVVGAALDRAWTHRQQRRRSIQSLYLTLLVHA